MSIFIRSNSLEIAINEFTHYGRLTSSMNSVQTTLNMEEVWALPNAASGVLIVDAEEMTYTALNPDSGTVTGLTRGVNSTTASAHYHDALIKIVDSTGSSINNQDNIYISKLNGNHISIYLTYIQSSLGTDVDTSITLSYFSKPHLDTECPTFYQIGYINSSNIAVPLVHTITPHGTPGQPKSFNIVAPVNISDNIFKIQIDYNGAGPSDDVGRIFLDIQFEESKTYS